MKTTRRTRDIFELLVILEFVWLCMPDAACVSVDTPKLNPKAIANTQHMDIHRFIYLPPIFLYLGFPI